MATLPAMLMLYGILLTNFCQHVYPRPSGHSLLDDIIQVLGDLQKRQQNVEPGCGKHPHYIWAENGEVINPSLPNGSYPNNKHCLYQLQVGQGKHIRITFMKVDLQGGETCTSDYLAFYDGFSSSSPELGRYCGRLDPPPDDIVTTGRILLIVFHSDSSGGGSGFKVSYSSEVSPQEAGGEPGCGQYPQVVQADSGALSGPTTPDGTYPDHRHCRYHIQVSQGKHVRLTFKKLDIENEATCSYDSVKLYDGKYEGSPELGTYCGSSLPQNNTLLSSGEDMLIVFHSDMSQHATGFKIWFHAYPDTCGTTRYTKRIYGGSDSRVHEWPWLIHIRVTYPPATNLSDAYWWQCGGALIDRKWVLTVASCFEYVSLRDRNTDTGRVYLYFGYHKQGLADFFVHPSTIIFHPGRSGFGVAPHDLALVKLPRRVEITDSVNTLCLPTSSDQFRVGQTCTVAGWGINHKNESVADSLMHAQLGIISKDDCQKKLGNQAWAMPIDDNLICGMGNSTQSICPGDAGAPLVCREEDRYHLSGLGSFSYHCGVVSYPRPSGFVRVSSYIDWIYNVMGNN